MCDFKVGDEVVCVDAGAWRGPTRAARTMPPHGLAEGATYTVTGFGVTPWDGSLTVFLAETRNVGIGGDYRAARFRKVERRTDKLSLTEWLSQPSGDTDKLDKTRAPAKRRERT